MNFGQFSIGIETNHELLQVSLIWKSILDVGNAKTKLMLGRKSNDRDAQGFTLNELVPNLDLGTSSTLTQNCRFAPIYADSPRPIQTKDYIRVKRSTCCKIFKILSWVCGIVILPIL
jgi:hypothetical protein